MTSGGPDDQDAEPTNQTALPEARPSDRAGDSDGDGGDFTPEPTELDADPTRLSSDVGIVGELRAILEDGSRKQLPLYRLPDQIVVGRGAGVDWRIDDGSLSRKHIQLKWNGQTLTVEDLGSANGTRVGGRPARTVTEVAPGELLQIGTVSIVLELRASGEDSTRPVSLPDGSEHAEPDSPDFALLDGRAPLNVVVATASPSSAFPASLPGTFIKSTEPRANAQVFAPAHGYARPDERTQPWDARAALVRKRARGSDSVSWAGLPSWPTIKALWRKNPRPFLLGGATAVLALVLGVWFLVDALSPSPSPSPDARATAPASGYKVSSLAEPSSDKAAGPIVTSLEEPRAKPAAHPADAPLLPAAARAQTLADAIAAYDQGHYAEALEHFTALSADSGNSDDAAVRFMVQLLSARTGSGK